MINFDNYGIVQTEVVIMFKRNKAVKKVDKNSPKFPAISKLTNTQRKILFALAENSVTNKYKTDKEIAKSIGVDPSTIYEFRQRPHCAEALDEYIYKIMPRPDTLAVELWQKCQKGNMKAYDLLLKISGFYD